MRISSLYAIDCILSIHKCVGIHENAHKCLEVLSARALFAPNRIFDYGNKFSIENYPKLTPMNSCLKKKCKFHMKERMSA